MSRVNIHPASIKYIKQGHPWITEDSFTKKFPGKPFLIAINQREQDVAFLLNDPTHKKVKARVWGQQKPFAGNEQEFLQELYTRLERSIDQRSSSNIAKSRENYYLVFGEADQLPGLQILKIKNVLFFIYYSFFWKNYERQLLSYVKKLLPEDVDLIISQERNVGKKNKRKVLYKRSEMLNSIVCSEFGINYEINLQDYYDLGLYTDMSSIRSKLRPTFEKSKSVLNLYSYTGAFSLYALKCGATDVHSVDLSGKYLNWLERNLTLNPELNANNHHRVEMNVNQAVEEYIQQKKLFDLVICDPPTFSSDGKEQTSSIKNYRALIPLLNKVVQKNGHIILFVNTHTLTRSQFNKKIGDILKQSKLDKKWEQVATLKLSKDAPLLKGFPEGDYLKGLVFRKAK